jgi:hypothetical protein
MNKFSKRRQSLQYRTDMPIFRPSVADMVRRARNRLLQLRAAHPLQFTAEHMALEPHEVFTERHLREVGKCVVVAGDVDRAVRAYGDFLQRYALHVRKLKIHDWLLI